MKRLLVVPLLALAASPARADLFGGDLPLLAEIVFNTLHTMQELEHQSEMLNKELRGIDDVIRRLQTIQDLTKPEDLNKWKNPIEAVRRLREIYEVLPDRFKTEKSREIERQLSHAMSLASQMTSSADSTFSSGKELETRALESGPAVAQKMGASGIGTLISLQSQNQVAQATIVSLLSQMLADNASKEASRIKSQSQEYENLSGRMSGLSTHIKLPEVRR